MLTGAMKGDEIGQPETVGAAPQRAKRRRRTRNRPGTAPGIERGPETDARPAKDAVRIQCIDFGPDMSNTRTIEDLDAFLAEEHPPGCTVRWINVDGLHPYVLERMRRRYGFHTLAGEDVLHVHQRPKIEPYDDHLFLIYRMVLMREGRLHDEQVSVLFFPHTVLTFQETIGDVWDPIRKRIEDPTSRLRTGSAAYLVYALFDAVVDHFFPVLEHYDERLEAIEEGIVERPVGYQLRALHDVKRELIVLQRVMWPMRSWRTT